VCEFAARRPISLMSPLLLLLFRGVSWSLPLQTLAQGDLRSAIIFALVLGFAEGSARVRIARTALKLAATARGLVITSGFATSRVRWADVLAVETWRRINGVDRVAVHYRGAHGGAVATCWDHFSRSELLTFVTACGARVSKKNDREKITLVGLSERGAWLPIVQRLALDLAIAACLSWFVKRALLLGAISGGMSALLACSVYAPKNRDFILKDGLWWRDTRRGLSRLSVIPPSLRMWVDALSGYEPRR